MKDTSYRLTSMLRLLHEKSKVTSKASVCLGPFITIDSENFDALFHEVYFLVRHDEARHSLPNR